MNLQEALDHPLWKNHIRGKSTYRMMGDSNIWKIAYYPLFENNKTKEVYNEPRALVERPITDGTDFREIPLRYLTLIQD